MISVFESFFEIQKEIHELLFSWIPFSVGDILYIFFGIFLSYFIIKCFKKKSRNESLLKILIFLNIFYFTYQIFWGMLYFQKPIISKLPDTKITLEKRKNLAIKYLEKCKQTRLLVKEDENGVFVISELKIIQKEILHQQTWLPNFISAKKGNKISSFKPSMFKNVMSFTGILGYYNPFSAEAQYNSDLPSSYLPFTLAHESSHQLGFAREQEANFVGYLIGVNSSNNELRYSTEYFTLKSLLNSIVYEDEKFVEDMIKNYSDGMKRDRNFEKDFNFKHQGLLNDFFGFTNNVFLKSNQQEGSVTYSYFIDLLVHYEK
ncbi:DUF3810 domain-containing protein [Chryseobacterium wangxinyae]|uniref:DUF3810 domain-containing protein n=1 Tax=Chryseobacterium sp. CY350 TaxID=2997336 RepID=UPI00226F03BE|nr:DUF3810 domain-containing protein [Chryseobacterium sp. CY350]MCY0979218.1 DUF3810 domain-containing protein [Chryseobacterium sp. CY350]WBZ94791.1 DUF3810 domain-containing protein [Chryseobacterium sp. CY350]